MSESEKAELVQGMEATRQTIIELLTPGNEFAENMPKVQRIEYEWDLWMIIGILDHDIQFKALQKVRTDLQEGGAEGPDFDFNSVKTLVAAIQ